MTGVDRRERLFVNPSPAPTLEDGSPTRDPLAFHRRLPGYAPTALREAAGIARDLGLDRLWVKDESERMGLPAFKIMGASWAVYRAIQQAMPDQDGDWRTLDDLARQLEPLKPLTLACATDGNHGRAVARMARLLGLGAHIFVPADMAPARRAAIAGEGARVTVVEGTYDDAVARSAEEASERTLIISDTSWPGYEDVPRWVIEGYSTIFWEVDDELRGRGE
jgi:diaminopropionate ammonia-lyase